METKLKDILDWLEDYKKRTACHGVILGLSGGKDSTVVAMLAKKVWGDKVLAVLMPNGEQSDLSDAINIAETIGVNYRVVNIFAAYTALLRAIEIRELPAPWCGQGYSDFIHEPIVSEKAKTNIPPRLRMTTLYAIGQSMGYRVIGTGNFSEAYIGWTTKWGDSAYDFNPIAHLTCTEVVEIGKILAREFALDEKCVSKPPSDGLTGKTDEDNFGFTYQELDGFLSGEDVDEKKKAKFLSLNSISEHKRNPPNKMNRTI